MKPYLQLDKLREGMFWVAGRGLRPPLLPRRGRAGVPPGRRRLRGEGRGRAPRRPLVLRPLGPPRQALGRLDERLPRPGALRRRGPDHRLEQLELPARGGGRAGPRELGRRHDDVPRVRPRPPRPQLERHLPLALRDVRGPRLRGVPLADPRALAGDARGPVALRAPLPHRAAHAEGAREEDRAGLDLPAGLRHRRVPGERARRHEAPPRRRTAHRPRRLRAGDARRPGHAARGRDAPPDAAVHARLLGRGLRGRLLQLPLVGRAGRRRLGGLHRGGRAVGRGGGEAPSRERLLGGEHRRSRGRLPGVPRPGRPDRRAHAQARLPGPSRRRRRPTDRPGSRGDARAAEG